MDIAREKRDGNIAEYILYIWQLEDLLRALSFDPRAVFAALVAPREATDEWKLSALEWYMDIAELLQKEGKADGGHLDHSLHLVGELNDLHLMLLEQPAGREYRELFARLAPSLPRLRATLGREDVSDIELAFRALYAAMLYRMKGAARAAGVGSGSGAGVGANSPTGAAKVGAGADNAARSAAGANSSAAKDADSAGIADEVVALISPVVAALSDMYHKVERGEIDLYKE